MAGLGSGRRTRQEARDPREPDARRTAGPAAAPGGARLPRFVVAVAVVAAIGGALFGYDTGVISGALPYLAGYFSLGSLGEGVVTSSLLIGAAFGSLAGGRIADGLGRRRALLCASVVFVAASLAVAFAPTAAFLVVARAVLGLAVGSASVITPLYLSEVAPPHVRGRLVSLNSLMIVSGQLLAYLVNAVLAHWAAWRWMLAFAAVPALALLAGMVFLPDTPRWYVGRGRVEDASRVLRRSLPEGGVEEELARIEEARAHERSARTGVRHLLRTPWLRRLLLIGVGLSVVQQVTGVNAVVYFAPTILRTTGLAVDTAITASIAVGVVSVLATVVGMTLVDRVGRRPLTLGGLTGMTVSLVLLGAAFLLPPSTGVSFLVLALMVCYMGCMQATLNISVWLLLAEMFPLRVRGPAMGAAVFVMWLCNFAVALLFPVVQEAVGASVTFWLFAVACVLSFVFCHRYAPETKGVPLEELEHRLRAGAGG
ncbi:sugar porter family MFS transporter [Streptomyces sp. NPDC059740]|uniref:sugar porter family MFS transporter n=1 Tax=Streptomyces sp. NPDC059740 TaxID=3346926 RepID=UPI003668D13F